MNKINIKRIKAATIQIIGNKTREEGVSFATQLTDLNSSEGFIRQFVENSFKTVDKKHFTYIDNLELNPVYNFVSKIFSNNELFIKQSVNLATYLYEQSLHPHIKSGEFYTILIDCIIDNEMIEALLLLKSEHKDAFLMTDNDGKVISVKTVYGASIRNMDKGCLILNQNPEDGYIVFIVDNTNNGNDARYWTESFLHVADCCDDYHTTLSIANLCSSFISKMQKSEKVDCLELALAASKNSELMNQDSAIDVERLPDLLFTSGKYKQIFNDFLQNYEGINNAISKTFVPKPEVIKRKSISRMNTIRLDNNFEVKILNSQAELIRGYDEEKEMGFYKLWFDKEY